MFVFLRDVEPGIAGFRLHLSFDPEIVQVVDADGDAENGVQIAAAAVFTGSQVITENSVDNTTGDIVLSMSQQDGIALQQTDTWRKVAAITWLGEKEGKSVIAIERTTLFATTTKRSVAPDAAHDGIIFARLSGRAEGSVRLQGRSDHRGVQISSSLLPTRVDRGSTDRDGVFEITVSHGEGFYTLIASVPGYLSAESDRPVKLTVGSLVDVGEVTLFGGDVNGDEVIDIRDLSFVAWSFDEYDPLADINQDGQVDILDLTLTAGNFGRSGPTTWQIPD